MRRDPIPFLLIVFVGSALLALGIVLAPAIRRFTGKQRWISSIQVNSTEIKLSKQRTFTKTTTVQFPVQDIDIEVPISAVTRGCESLHAAVVTADQSSGVSGKFLIRFKYRLLDSKCVSSDLSFAADTFPDTVSISLVETDVSDTLSEEKVTDTFAFGLDQKRNLINKPVPSVSEEILPPVVQRQLRSDYFSWSPQPDEVELISNPYDGISDSILAEIQRRTVKCQTGKGCDKIWGAIARISDGKIIKALDTAAHAGLDVQIISNPTDMVISVVQKVWKNVKSLPWSWLRGNPLYAERGMRLPMHTKFFVFGNDMVISSNGNLVSERFSESREYALRYHGSAPAKIFTEIFSLIRSGIFYPLHVNSTDGVAILLNAERPLGYGPAYTSPSVKIVDQNGAVSSAYGIVFDILNREGTNLKLAMSPLTSSCASYNGKLCLSNILQKINKLGSVDILLNGAFYLGENAQDSVTINGGLWSQAGLQAYVLGSTPYMRFPKQFELGPRSLNFSIILDRPYSAHHERIAVMNDQVLIAGSANFANLSTVNTIELIRNKQLSSEVLKELTSAQEPYFVAKKGANSPAYRTVGDCEFIFEATSRSWSAPSDWALDQKALSKEVERKYGLGVLPMGVITPNYTADSLTYLKSLQQLQFAEAALVGPLRQQTSYLCVRMSDGTARPVRIYRNAKDFSIRSN